MTATAPPAPAIGLACLDLAGTTIADGGTVEAAFAEAMSAAAVPIGSRRFADSLEYVRATMGQSKIEVFRTLLGDDEAAANANDAFERAYDVEVAAGNVAPLDGAEDVVRALQDAGIRVCFTTGFSPTTRDALLKAVGWAGLADLALSPADAEGHGRPSPAMILTAVVRLGIDDVRAVAAVGDTTSDLLAGWRSGASVVAGVLTGAHDRATLATAPHTHLLDSIADLPAVVVR